MTGKGVIYAFVMRWGTYFTLLGEGDLLSLHWVPVVRLQTRPAEMHCTWNGTCIIGCPGLAYPIPIHLFKPDSAPSLANMYGVHKQVKFLKLHHIDIQGSGHGVCNSYRKERGSHPSSY